MKSRTSLKLIRPILLLEINEVPWKLVDLYSKKKGYPHLKRFFSESKTFTTKAVDEGELSPWVTWPSFHRGMGNQKHGVKNLGQDPATFKGVPIWEEYLQRGHDVGVCGSLQSWPPMNPGEKGFFIPDTFAHDEQCFPSWVEPFQKFNLGQVRQNGRVLDNSKSMVSGVLPLLKALPRLGIPFRFVTALVRQVIAERFHKSAAARRPAFQTLLFWEVFRRLFRPSRPPDFSSFFTNHVAGVMHRYWHHVFPEDFGGLYTGDPREHLKTMDFAMALTDRILGEAMDWVQANPDLIVVFASSMGQDAIRRDRHEGFEASIPDPANLMAVCGLSPHEFKTLLAMVPQVGVEIPITARRQEVKSRLEGATTQSGKNLFRVQETGDSLSITIETPSRSDAQAGTFSMGAGANGSSRISWEQAGIRMLEVEPGTGYHIPEGTMAVYEPGRQGQDERRELAADDAKSFLMRLSGLVAQEPENSGFAVNGVAGAGPL